MTGGTGSIGRPLVKHLLGLGHEVRVLQRKKNSESEQGIVPVYGDILKPESYREALQGTDTVIHAAALTRTNNIADYFRTNTRATLDLIKACELNSVKRFIFISTRAISEQGGGYCLSKLKAEELVRNSFLDWVILRLSEVYGLSGGEGVDGIIRAVEKFPCVPVIGDGAGVLCPVHIRDVISAVCSVLDHGELQRKIYLIAGPENFRYTELVDQLLLLYGIAKPKLYIPRPVLRILLRMVSVFSEKPAFVMDQLPRFLSSKSGDISASQIDFGYDPGKISDVVRGKGK